MIKQNYRAKALCGAAFGVFWVSTVAAAQTATAGSTPQAMPSASGETEQAPTAARRVVDATDSSGNLGEIVVVATRRSTNLQNTGMSITAVTGSALQEKGILDTVALQQVTPGLTFNQNSAFAQPYIRGVGTDITAPGSESSVATFIDGVYQPFPFVGVQVLNAVQGIEVLKGPQGTLYGRNATGGAINVQTRNPGNRPEVEADFSYGNYNAKLGHLYLSAPLTDTLAFNIAGSISDRDGYGKNLTTGKDYNSESYQYIRGKLRWDATPSLEVILTGYYFHRNDDSYMGYTYDPRWGSIPAPGAFGGKVTLLSQDIYTAYPLANKVDDYGGNLRIGWKVGSGALTSITAYQKAKALIGPDFVSTNIPIFDFAANPDSGRNFSEDLFYTGDLGRLSYTIGGTYANSSAKFDPLSVIVGTVLATNSYQYIDTKAFAGYGELTYKLTDDFTVTGGIRYSDEKKTQARLDTYTAGGALISSVIPTSRTFKNTSYKALAQYKFGNAMLYAKFESGFKSGTVVASVPGLFIKPETINSYEAGLKSELLGKSLRLNVAGYYYDYKNIQVQYTDVSTGQALVESADKARIWGVEAQITAAPTENFSVDLGVNYLNTKYVNFLSSGAFVPNTALVGPGVPGNTNVTIDVSGNHLVRSPPITINLGLNWKIPFQNGSSLTNSATLYFSDKYFFEVTNRTNQPAYALLGGQMRYQFAKNRLAVAVFGRNLANTKYLASEAPNSFGDAGQLAPPRTFGVTVSAKY